MKITVENVERLKLAVEVLLDEEEIANGTRHQALDKALTTLGFKLREEYHDDGVSKLLTDVNHVKQVWVGNRLRRSVMRWLEIQRNFVRYGWRDQEGARLHRQQIDKHLPELQMALFNTALQIGKVYDK